jgi:RNA polymerase sigma factor (sigma-70 family)
VIDDDALAARAAAGDAAAFALLVRRHEARVRGFLRRVAGPEQADDLAQEAFLKAWRGARGYRGPGSYPGWLLRIAWRGFLDARRRRGDPAMAVDAPLPPAVDARIDVSRVLAALSAEERACLVLCLGQGYSHADAASILDLPLGTVKSRVARAAAKARALLGEAR